MNKVTIMACLLWAGCLYAAEEPSPMDLQYAELEQARERLQWRLDALQYRVRGRSMPAAEAGQIGRALGHGYHILRHPPLRAAFRSQAELTAEQQQVDSINRRLDRVEALLAPD